MLNHSRFIIQEISDELFRTRVKKLGKRSAEKFINK